MVADVEILAENAAKVATGEEYRTRASRSDEYAFLAEMRAYRADYGHLANAAEAEFAAAALYAASPWAERAGIGQAP